VVLVAGAPELDDGGVVIMYFNEVDQVIDDRISGTTTTFCPGRCPSRGTPGAVEKGECRADHAFEKGALGADPGQDAHAHQHAEQMLS
jgi:hypothetical protein